MLPINRLLRGYSGQATIPSLRSRHDAAKQAEDAAALAAAEAKAAMCSNRFVPERALKTWRRSIPTALRRRRAAILGVFKRGTLAKELEDKTFAMKAGEVTDVIRTKQGYVILKVPDHQMAGIPPMKDVEPKIQDALYYQKLQPALRAYLTKLREEAYIEIQGGVRRYRRQPEPDQAG